MKASIVNSRIKNTFLSIFTSILVLSLSSCAKKVSFQNSSVVPAARGDVKVKKDNNKNYVIKVHLYNLAEVQRLQPAKQTYIVWLVTDTGLAKNIGQINSTTGFLSKQLSATFETVSALKPTKIFITAEDDASIQYPGVQTILSTESF